MSIDDRDIAFNTSLNYLKRYRTGTFTHTFTGNSQVGTSTIAHNLTYVPAVRVFYEYNGMLFEAAGQSQSPPPAANGTSALYTLTSSNLEIKLYNSTNGAITMKGHYIIYLDSAT